MSDVPLDETASPPRGVLGALDRALAALATLAGVLAAAMMLVTVTDVVGRGLFNKPLIGAFETIELLMASIVFLALPFVTWRREHVTVTLFYERMPPRAQSISTALSEIVAAIVCGLLAWRAWLYGERLLNVGERTLELGVPRGFVPIGVAIVLALAGGIFLLLAARALFRGERAPA